MRKLRRNSNNLNRKPVIIGSAAAYVPLTHGYIAIIDAEDLERVSRYKWYAHHYRSKVYAKATTTDIFMHRFILKTPKGKDTDHANRNTLDNRKCNLRVCTKSQNSINRSPKPHSSIYKGVYFYCGKWKVSTGARLGRNRKHLGFFESEVEAAKAYDAYIRKIDPEFGYLNFPEEKYGNTEETDQKTSPRA
jgi:hypothetical protein